MTSSTRSRSYYYLVARSGWSISMAVCTSSEQDRHEVFKNLIYLYSNGKKVQYDIVQEKQYNLFETSVEYALAYCVPRDVHMARGLAVSFKTRFRKPENLRERGRKLGKFVYGIYQCRHWGVLQVELFMYF